MKWTAPAVLCLVAFHTPDGRVIKIDTHHIMAVRTAEAVKQHLAPGTNTVLYVGAQNFGVTESPDEVQMLIDECVGD